MNVTDETVFIYTTLFETISVILIFSLCKKLGVKRSRKNYTTVTKKALLLKTTKRLRTITSFRGLKK